MLAMDAAFAAVEWASLVHIRRTQDDDFAQAGELLGMACQFAKAMAEDHNLSHHRGRASVAMLDEHVSTRPDDLCTTQPFVEVVAVARAALAYQHQYFAKLAGVAERKGGESGELLRNIAEACELQLPAMNIFGEILHREIFLNPATSESAVVNRNVQSFAQGFGKTAIPEYCGAAQAARAAAARAAAAGAALPRPPPAPAHQPSALGAPDWPRDGAPAFPAAGDKRSWAARAEDDRTIFVPLSRDILGSRGSYSTDEECHFCRAVGHFKWDCPARFSVLTGRAFPGFCIDGRRNPAGWTGGDWTESTAREWTELQAEFHGRFVRHAPPRPQKLRTAWTAGRAAAGGGSVAAGAGRGPRLS
mmetsp:Transcript_38052/g.101195  ORF Transcript_38052/g.101195 Transcript_38052/m.101195 type:complete len:361 (-) Transcript_38052:1874-2956(-)